MRNAALIRVLLAASMVLLLPLQAKADFKATPEEQQMCQTTVYSRIVKGDPNWTHVHHYCDCIRFTNRAYRLLSRDKAEAYSNLGEALGGCNYVFSHTTPDFELRPEIHLQSGIIQSLRGQHALAATEYTAATNGNPKLTRAYMGLAEFFLKNKDQKTALETITKGLRHNPDSKALKRMYTELGGKMPFPEPVAAATSKPVATAEPPAVGGSAPPADIPPPQEKTETPDASVANSSDTTMDTKPEIGSPTNPWCRFCPDTPAAPAALTPAMPGAIPRAAP